MEASMIQLPFPKSRCTFSREWGYYRDLRAKMQQEDLYGA